MTADERALTRILGTQRGVISRVQAYSSGMSDKGIRHRLRPGGPWQRLLPGVYLTVTGQPTLEQLEMAALLHAGPAAVLTGPAALRNYGLPGPRTPTIDVLIPAGNGTASRGFAVMHRTRRMPPRVAYRGPVSYVFPARAIADMTSELARLSDVRALVAGAVQQGWCTVGHLSDELRQRPGRGTALFRAVLAEVAEGIRSSPEGDLRDLVISAGLPTPLYNPRLYLDGRFLAQADAWWPAASVLAEVDSAEWHLSPDRWEATMRRHARLAAAGLVVLHFSPRQIRTEPRVVTQSIAGALAAGRPAINIVTKPAAG